MHTLKFLYCHEHGNGYFSMIFDIDETLKDKIKKANDFVVEAFNLNPERVYINII